MLFVNFIMEIAIADKNFRELEKRAFFFHIIVVQ